MPRVNMAPTQTCNLVTSQVIFGALRNNSRSNRTARHQLEVHNVYVVREFSGLLSSQRNSLALDAEVRHRMFSAVTITY